MVGSGFSKKKEEYNTNVMIGTITLYYTIVKKKMWCYDIFLGK